MPTFRYVAKDKAGKIQRGSAEAADEDSLQKQLQQSGYWLVHAQKVTHKTVSTAQESDTGEERQKQIYIAIGLAIMAAIAWAVIR